MALTSIFSRYNNAINNINNPIELLNQIVETSNNLLPNKFPFVSKKLIELYNIEKNIPENLLTELITLTNSLVSGFNKITINTIVLEPESVLVDVDSDFKPFFVNLKNISSISFGDLLQFRNLKRLNNGFQIENFFLFEIDQFSRYLINNDNSLILNNTSAIGNILSRFLMKNLFQKNLDQIEIINDFTTDQIDTRFASYIDSNKTILASKITNFIFQNVLFLTNVSSSLQTKVNSVIETELLNLKQIFSNTVNTIVLSFYGQIIISNITTFLENYLTSTSTDFSIASDDSIKAIENAFYDNLRLRITETQISKLESLEKISYQFKNFPLYFINSHFVLYNNITNFLLNDNEFIQSLSLTTLSSISSWKSSVSIPGNITFDLMTQLDASKSVEYNYINNFTNVINDFINSKDFENYLIDTLFITIESEIKKFFPDIKENLFKNIDQFKLFIKSLLIQDLVNEVLWSEFKADFRNKFAALTLNPITTSDISFAISDFQSQDQTLALQKLLDNFIISSSISLLMDILLDNFRITTKF